MVVIIEIFVYSCLAGLAVFGFVVAKRAERVERSDVIYFGVILSLLITQLLIQMSSEIRGSFHLITYLSLGGIVALSVIYLSTRLTASLTELQEYTRVRVTWAMFLVVGINFFLLLFEDSFGLKQDMLRIPLSLALCLGMAHYPPLFDRLAAQETETESETEADEGSTVEPSSEVDKQIDPEPVREEIEEVVPPLPPEPPPEDHKDTVVALTTESWHFTTVYEAMITKLDASEQRKSLGRLRWHRRKMEQALQESGIRIVNVEGHMYDPGMAATPVNLEDFEADDLLVVNRMLEPIIMEGTNLVKMGRVTLKRRTD